MWPNANIFYLHPLLIKSLTKRVFGSPPFSPLHNLLQRSHPLKMSMSIAKWIALTTEIDISSTSSICFLSLFCYMYYIQQYTWLLRNCFLSLPTSSICFDNFFALEKLPHISKFKSQKLLFEDSHLILLHRFVMLYCYWHYITWSL